MIFIGKKKSSGDDFTYPETVVLALDANEGFDDQSPANQAVSAGSGISITNDVEIYPGHVTSVFSFVPVNFFLVPYSASLSFSGDFSIDYWYSYANPASEKLTFLSFYKDTNNKLRFSRIAESENCYIQYVSAGNERFYRPNYTSAGVWTHIGLSRTGQYLKLVVNGQENGGTTYHTDLIDLETDMTIGAKNETIGGLNGMLANIRVVNGVSLDYETLWTEGKLFRLRDAHT